MESALMNRRILVVLADEHAGSNVGLLNPDCILEKDEFESIVRYSPQLSPYQEMLWSVHTDHLNTVSNFANGDEIILFHNGDLTRGNKYWENWVSPRLSDQILIAFYNIKPWLNMRNVKIARLSKGTGSHVFGEGSSEILVGELLRREYQDKDISVVYHGSLGIDGCEIDYAHHGPHPGTRDWLKGNVAQLYLRDLMYRLLKQGIEPPKIIIRAHYHVYVRVVQIVEWGNKEYESTLIICPSYCGPEDYVIKATRSVDTIVNGLIIIELINGRVASINPLLEFTDLRIKEIL